MTHTPGPWLACNEATCPCMYVSGENGPVAKVINGEWGDDFPAIRLVGESSLDRKAEAFMDRIPYGTVDPEVAQSNARLIAAAPELLAVLKKLCAEDVPHSWEEWREAKAAIAKAEGR